MDYPEFDDMNLSDLEAMLREMLRQHLALGPDRIPENDRLWVKRLANAIGERKKHPQPEREKIIE